MTGINTPLHCAVRHFATLRCFFAKTLPARIYMLALKNFIQYGVNWSGTDDDVRFMQTRPVKVILTSLADQIRARNPEGGVKTGRPGLSGFTYQKSTVSAVAARLIKLGIVVRDRSSRNRGQYEDFATTGLSPTVLVHSAVWLTTITLAG